MAPPLAALALFPATDTILGATDGSPIRVERPPATGLRGAFHGEQHRLLQGVCLVQAMPSFL